MKKHIINFKITTPDEQAPLVRNYKAECSCGWEFDAGQNLNDYLWKKVTMHKLYAIADHVGVDFGE